MGMRRAVELFGDSDSGVFSLVASSKFMIESAYGADVNARVQNLPNLDNRMHIVEGNAGM